MKSESKSATKSNTAILFLLCLFVSACADVKAPMWLTGEPGDDVLSAPRVVAVPKNSSEKAWPNLAEVPDKKPKFSKQADLADQIDVLQSENLEAQSEMERIRNIQLEETRTRELMPDDEEPFSFSALKP